MRIKTTVGVAALLMSFTMANQATAGFFRVVPEFDGSSSIAVIALLMSVGAVLFRGSKKA
jgi:hypothetical protein